ncbi:MAG: AAA family ATPase [Deltaproteobacteria bacterium]|nr:AAA family ATPase [Deltaproteobacteria bacterium]
MSRPRRLGKTLLLKNISEPFQGDRELFKGLWLGTQSD